MNALVTTEKLLKLRASSMPIAFKCGGSVRPCAIDVDEINEAAETGTAAHACLEGLARNGQVDFDSIDLICDELEGDSEEVRMLCGKASRMWPQLRDTFPCALTEIAISRDLPSLDVAGLQLTGHIDLISIVGEQVRILDWKTGRLDANYSHQMKAYLAMVLLAYPHLTGGTATIAWVRYGEVENYTMTRADAEAWIESFEDRVLNWDGVYRTGRHCGHCRRFHECHAGNALARSYVASIADVSLDAVEASVANMVPDEAIDLYHKAKMVSKIAEKALEAIKARALRSDIEGSETKLTIETEGRREVDILKAWPVLEGLGFGDEDYAACMKLSISKFEKRVADRVPKGEGAAARKSAVGRLEAAGAININEAKKLTERRI